MSLTLGPTKLENWIAAQPKADSAAKIQDFSKAVVRGLPRPHSATGEAVNLVKGTNTNEVTAWVEPEPGDELEVTQAQKKRRGGRGRQFGPHDVVRHMPINQVVKRLFPACRSRSRSKVHFCY